MRRGDSLAFHFWVCLTTLVFDGLAPNVKFGARSEVFDPAEVIIDDDITISGNGGSGHDYSIHGDVIDARLSARQLTQYLRTRPMYSERGWLSRDARGAVSFEESAFPD